MSVQGLGCAKSQSDLVVMPCRRRIFTFACTARDHRPQNYWCVYTAWCFHTARVNCTHYRAAALLSASPQLAELIRAAKRFRVVPLADQVHCSKQRAYWVAFPTSTIRGTRIVKVEPRPGSLSTVEAAAHHLAEAFAG